MLAPYRNMVHAVREIAREEGFRGFYRGLTPSLLLVRQCACGSCRRKQRRQHHHSCRLVNYRSWRCLCCVLSLMNRR